MDVARMYALLLAENVFYATLYEGVEERRHASVSELQAYNLKIRTSLRKGSLTVRSQPPIKATAKPGTPGVVN